jgi:AraC-like DNA-binding protein
MEKERIRFEQCKHPIILLHLRMSENQIYRGMHSHKAIEIVSVKSGVLHCYVNDERVVLAPGQVIFINSHQSHRLSSKNAEISYLYIDTGLVEENTNEKTSKLYAFISLIQAKPYLVLSDNAEFTQLLHKIDLKYHDDAKETPWYMKAYLYELIAFMYAKSFIAPFTIAETQIAKIEQVVRYIEENFKSPITLDDICTAVTYNKYTICHTFKMITGSTIFDYINFLRATYAVEKLKETESSILEIATACGFSSATYFNRVFKTYFGCAPSVYRKILRKGIIN